MWGVVVSRAGLLGVVHSGLFGLLALCTSCPGLNIAAPANPLTLDRTITLQMDLETCQIFQEKCPFFSL